MISSFQHVDIMIANHIWFTNKECYEHNFKEVLPHQTQC